MQIVGIKILLDTDCIKWFHHISRTIAFDILKCIELENGLRKEYEFFFNQWPLRFYIWLDLKAIYWYVNHIVADFKWKDPKPSCLKWYHNLTKTGVKQF